MVVPEDRVYDVLERKVNLRSWDVAECRIYLLWKNMVMFNENRW